MPESFKKRFQSYILNPLFLALFPSVVIFLTIPFQGKKYDLEKTGSVVLPPNSKSIYLDLDNGNWSDRISIFSSFNSSGVTLYRKDIIVDQWNVKGNFDFAPGSLNCIAADCNGDGGKEIYLFAISGDSIFLNSIDDSLRKELCISDRFIAKFGKGITKPDPYIINAEPEDMNGDGINELIFGIGTGFSKFPRQIYSYYVQKDSLVVSPESSFFISGITQADINSDGFREIILGGYGASNIHPGEAKFHDESGWLMVLNKNLDFLFEPVEFKGQYSGITPLIYIDKKETIISAITFKPHTDTASFLVDFDSRGRIVYNELPEVATFTGFVTHDRKKGPMFVLLQGSGVVSIYDRNKKFIRNENTGPNTRAFQRDIDLDGEKEIIMLLQNGKKVVVFRSDMKHKSETAMDIPDLTDCTISVKNVRDKDPVLTVQFGNTQHELIYRKNPHFFLALLFYPATYSGFFIFIYLILLFQKKTIDKRIAIEKRMAELQMAMLRNQLDPHFILNAINSIVYLVHTSENEKASEGLRSFSTLYRDMVLAGNETRRSLKDEIEFCRNYLILEKIRYGERLNYGIFIMPGLNLEIPVPKMIIQLYVENGIKHGISKLERGGHIDIIVSDNGNGCYIEITDNGVGRGQNTKSEGESTGKGMALMKELFDVYNRYYKEKISVEVIDLFKKEEPAGTKIIITIANQS